jgi:hypothetical protein
MLQVGPLGPLSLEPKPESSEPLPSVRARSVAPSASGVIQGVEIRNFTFDSGPARGDDITFNRTQGYSLYDNAFRGLAANGIFSVASSGKIVGNYISVDVTGAAVAAGYPASPSTVEFVGNRLVGNIAGLVLIGSTSRVPETGDQLDVLVRNNDLSENNRVAGFSFGLRIFTINRPLGAAGDTQSTGNDGAGKRPRTVDRR